MRMRKKKHLDDRLDAVKELLLPIEKHDPDIRRAADEPKYYDIVKIFGNMNPLHLEIGCGKGQFIAEIAKRNPDINYVAIEVCDDVAVLAAEKVKAAGAIGINCKYVNVSQKLVERFQAEGLLVSLWTVDNKRHMIKCSGYKPDNITSRHPD